MWFIIFSVFMIVSSSDSGSSSEKSDDTRCFDNTPKSSFHQMVDKARCQARCNELSLNVYECLTKCSERNFTSVPDVKDMPESGLLTWLTKPGLYCHMDTLLTVTWEILPHTAGISFLLELRDKSQCNWEPYNTTPSSIATIQNLKPNTTYKVQVRPVSSEGFYGEPNESDWISTLPVDAQPGAVTNITVKDTFEFSASKVNMTVQWEPAGDRTCSYRIVWWNHDALDQNIYRAEGKFEAEMENLDFDAPYTVTIMSVSCLEENAKCESKKAQNNFRTPTCLAVHNNNLTICYPPAPTNISVLYVPLSAELCDANVSWALSDPRPDEYVTVVKQVIPEGNFTNEQHVPGNVTMVKIHGMNLDTRYAVCISAVAPSGNSTTCEYFRLVFPSSETWGSTHLVLVICLPIAMIITVPCIAFLYRRYKKRQENERRCQYFKELEKQTPKESKACEPSFVEDEWEIPEDRLLLGDILGEGAFGVVRKGLLQGQTPLEPLQEVAVKMLINDSTSEDLRQFHQEINMMKSVGQHPHIVSIIGCCTCSRHMRLIVEYCALGDLQNYLRKAWTTQSSPTVEARERHQTISENQQVKYAELMSMASNGDAESYNSKQVSIVVNQMYFESGGEDKKQLQGALLKASDLLSFARQIAMGMEFLASNRIVHRDLAARNVLVCSNKMVKISDFGLSRDIYEQNVYHKKGSGKVPIKWMAIESLLYQVYTTQSDIWSFGILLWEIVTFGGTPYPSTPASRIFKLLKTGYRMECPNNCSPELYDLMLSCWKAKPKDRPTFTELRNKLDSLLENSTTQQYLNLNSVTVESPITSQSTVEQPSSGSQSNMGIEDYCNVNVSNQDLPE